MPQNEPVTPDTLKNMAAQFLGQRLSDADVAAAAVMLSALAADMRAFRQMPLGDDEPAPVYSAAEATS